MQRYIEFFEQLNRERVKELEQIATADVLFRDPFNETRSIAGMIRVLEQMYEDVEDPSFRVTDCVEAEGLAFLKWIFTCKPKRLKSNSAVEIIGVSEVRYNSSGLISSHVDYWDAASQFYERIPILGLLLRAIKKRLKVDG